jgi:hypothetical protein
MAAWAKSGMTRLMRHHGDRWGKAPTGRFFSSLNDTQVHGRRHADHDATRADLFNPVEAFQIRSGHSTLGHVSSIHYLQR